jgi:hypothetical protein
MSANPSLPPQSSQPAQVSPQSAPLSEGQRIADVFFAPTKTFTDLRRNASWWGPFLIIAIVSLIFVAVVDQKVGFRKVADNQLQMSPKQADQVERLPPDQREKNAQLRTSITKGISYAVPAIAILIYAVFAGVLFGTLKFAANADIKYKALFALIVYTRLPEVLRAVLTIVSLLAGVSGDGFNIENPVALNPGYFIGPEGSPVLRALLTPLDVITIWTLVLTAIGITCISNVKRGTAYAVVFGWFALVVLIRVGLATLAS